MLGPNVVKLGEQERGDTKWLNAAVATPRWTGSPQVAERNGDHGKHQVVAQLDETAAARAVTIGVAHRAAIGFAFEDHPPGRGEGRIADLTAQAPQTKGSPTPAEIGAKSNLEYRTKHHAHEGVGGVASRSRSLSRSLSRSRTRSRTRARSRSRSRARAREWARARARARERWTARRWAGVRSRLRRRTGRGRGRRLGRSY